MRLIGLDPGYAVKAFRDDRGALFQRRFSARRVGLGPPLPMLVGQGPPYILAERKNVWLIELIKTRNQYQEDCTNSRV